MASVELSKFKTGSRDLLRNVYIFIENLPENSTATVKSKNEFCFSCAWFIFYEVVFGGGQTKYFFELVPDSSERGDYLLNITYDSNKALCSFDSSTERIIFVNSCNKKLADQDRPIFYEYVFGDNSVYLVIFKKNILISSGR